MNDLIVVFLIAVAATGAGVALRRRGARGWPLVRAIVPAAFGVILVVMLGAHEFEIAGRILLGQTYAGSAMTYEFRTYALLLFGALLIGAGVSLVRHALALAAGRAAAGAAAMRTAAFVLAVVAPLIPIHGFFAIPLTGLAAVTLACLAIPAPGATASGSTATAG